MEKKDRLFISIYNDYYGSLLTEYQRRLIDDYYNQDMSLGELAKEYDISPQGVRDALKRAEKQLCAYEERLGLAAKTQEIKAILEEVLQESSEQNKAKLLRAIERLVD